ncbi:MAG: hypothetical protein AAGA60_32685 [Cyanobacteria bacterium P01_E01_bin.42]
MTQYLRAIWDTNGAQYEADRGTKLDIIRQIAIPSDGDEAKMKTVILAAKGKVADDPVPCTSTGWGDLRHLIVKRKSGHTMKIPLYLRADLVDTVKAIVDAADKINANNPVICFDIVGEKILNLYEKLVTSTANPAPVDEIKPPVAEGKARIMYSTTMTAYKTEAPYGGNTSARFSMITNIKNAPPSAFTTLIPTCVGSVQDVLCGGKSGVKPRHYTPTFLTKNPDLPTQTISIPTASNSPTDILKCGQDLANLPHVICLAYQGQSIKRANELAVFN